MAIWNTCTSCFLESHAIFFVVHGPCIHYSLFRCVGFLSSSTPCFSTDSATYFFLFLFFFGILLLFRVIPDLLCTCISRAVAHTQSHNFSLHCFFFLLCIFTIIPHRLA